MPKEAKPKAKAAVRTLFACPLYLVTRNDASLAFFYDFSFIPDAGPLRFFPDIDSYRLRE